MWTKLPGAALLWRRGFAQAELVLVCKKAYWQDMDPAHFLDPEVDGKHYPGRDYHRIYIGEIVEALKKV